jgi:hypothetical protein
MVSPSVVPVPSMDRRWIYGLAWMNWARYGPSRLNCRTVGRGFVRLTGRCRSTATAKRKALLGAEELQNLLRVLLCL